MDGYVQHAYVGNRSVIDIDEESSSFEVKDGKITGKLDGTITKEYAGKTDNFSINLNAVPFDGAGGGFDTVFVTVDQDVQTQVNTVKSSSMTCNQVLELIEENKPVVAVVTLNLLLNGSSVGKDISSMLVNNYNSTGNKPTAAGYSIKTYGTDTTTKILSTVVRFTKDEEMPKFK